LEVIKCSLKRDIYGLPEISSPGLYVVAEILNINGLVPEVPVGKWPGTISLHAISGAPLGKPMTLHRDAIARTIVGMSIITEK